MSSTPKGNRKPVRVILDSNAMFVPFQLKIDIFEEIESLLNTKVEPIILSPIQRELEKLALKGSPKTRKEAEYALRMADKCKSIKLDEDYVTYSPDDAIFQVAKEQKYPVFTNDRELRKKLRNINVPVIYVRQKSHLQIDGRI